MLCRCVFGHKHPQSAWFYESISDKQNVQRRASEKKHLAVAYSVLPVADTIVRHGMSLPVVGCESTVHVSINMTSHLRLDIP